MNKIYLHGNINAAEDPLTAKEIEALREEIDTLEYYSRNEIFEKMAKKHPAVKELHKALKWAIDKWDRYLWDCQYLVDKEHEKQNITKSPKKK
ncbi:MAG: hypothetical protein LBK69_07005 [Syntrophomonadaceae bacterium]|jgi:predicted solute-binding protein|nr:hypothetical protein [Syntrophomonadaceae bacterium]